MHMVHTNEYQQVVVLCFIFSTKETYQKPRLEWTKSKKQLVLANTQRRTRITRRT